MSHEPAPLNQPHLDPAEERRRKAKERYLRWKLRHPGREAENRRRWKAANKDKVAAARRRYASAHPDKVKAKWQRHQAKHPDKCAARSQKYREKNREKVRAYLRAYFQTPAGKVARVSGENRRRARKKGCEQVATTRQLEHLLINARHCHYCGVAFSDSMPPTLDHIVPLAKGGPHSPANIVTACRPCNSLKGDTDADQFLVKLASVVK